MKIGIYEFQKYALVFLLTGSALLINPFFTTDIFEFPKLLVLIIAIELLTIFNIIRIAQDGFRKMSHLPLEFFFLGLLFLGHLFAYFFSLNRTFSLMGDPMRFQGFLTNIHYFLLTVNVFVFFGQYHLEKTRSLFTWLLIALLTACGLALLPYATTIYIFEPAFFYDRVFGTFGNPNYLAVFIIAILPLILFLNQRRKIFICLLFPLAIITLFLTGSRSSWMAILAAFLLFGVFDALKYKKYTMLRNTLISIAILVALVGAQHIFPQSSKPMERLSVRAENLVSFKTRVSLWKAGFQMFLDRPLFGSGQDMIKNTIEPYLPERLKANEVFFIDRTHSEWIDVLAIIGIFGFIGYAGFFIIIFYKSIKLFLSTPPQHRDPIFTASVIGFSSLLIFHTVNFSTITSNVLLYFLAGFLAWYGSKLLIEQDHYSVDNRDNA